MAARAHDAAEALPAVDDDLLIGSVRDRAGEPDAAQQRPNCRRYRRYPDIRPRPAPPLVAHAPRMRRKLYFFVATFFSICLNHANSRPKSSTERRQEFERNCVRKQ
ncbi:hypothetical protein OWT26_09985 [Burkholderia sp. 1A5]